MRYFTIAILPPRYPHPRVSTRRYSFQFAREASAYKSRGCLPVTPSPEIDTERYTGRMEQAWRRPRLFLRFDIGYLQEAASPPRRGRATQATGNDADAAE